MKRKEISSPSPIRFLLYIIVSTFITEAIIMILLKYLPSMPDSIELLLDSSTLVLVISPILYFFAYKPIKISLEEVKMNRIQVKMERDKLDAVIQAIGDGVFVLDKEQRIVLVNATTEQISGYENEELINKSYREVLKFVFEKNNEPNTAFIDQVYQTGKVSNMTNHTALIRKDGNKVSVADSAAPLKNEEGITVGSVVVFRDVTIERTSERMKDEFISIASHQLRTPLTALRWLTERLQKDEKLNSSQKEIVEDMQSSTKRLIQLVNDLLNISRIESGRIIVDPNDTDLKELVQSTIVDLAGKIDEKKQTIDLTVDSEVPHLSIDSKLVRQVIMNLLTNASKYSPIEEKIWINISLKNNKVITSIIDNGWGVPQTEQKLLFQKFYRASNAVQNDSDGTGLGLYLAKKIIEASGGDIGFKSPLSIDDQGKSKGSEFWFTLPVSGSRPQKGEIIID